MEALPHPLEMHHSSSPTHSALPWHKNAFTNSVSFWDIMNGPLENTRAVHHPTVYHIYGINTWKLNMVYGWRQIMVSFIFTKKVVSAWRASLRVITKWYWAQCRRLGKGSAKPSSHMEWDGGRLYFFQYFVYIQEKKIWQIQQDGTWPLLPSNSNTNEGVSKEKLRWANSK